jgi:hypothetical protein
MIDQPLSASTSVFAPTLEKNQSSVTFEFPKGIKTKALGISQDGQSA